MRRIARCTGRALLAIVAAGCTYPALPRPGARGVEHKDIPLTPSRDVDLLFVIDDSPSMADKQANLATNFPRFVEVLSSIGGSLPNVHIGVVTTDLGAKGTEDAAPQPDVTPGVPGGCKMTGRSAALQLSTAPVTGTPYLVDVEQADHSRLRNYTGTLADVFATMAKVGERGCGFEQTLEAMRQALLPSNTANTGFLRASAALAVIFITDEDDCSLRHAEMIEPEPLATLGPQQSFRCTRFGVLCDDNGTTPAEMNQVGAKGRCHSNEDSPYLTKVADYAAFLNTIKPNPRSVVVGALMAPPGPIAVELRAPSASATPIPALARSCSYTDTTGATQVGDPPVRLKQFLDALDERATFAPICQENLASGLQQIADLVNTALAGDPCIESTLTDVDAAQPGPQYSCTVSAVDHPGEAGETTTPLPRCTADDATATNQPCWHLSTDATACPRSDHLALKIEGQVALARTAHIVASCITDESAALE